MKRQLAMLLLTVSIAGLAACASSPGVSSRPAAAPNAVTDWASIIQPAIHSPSEPRSPAGSFVLHTMAQLAVYNAVGAIDGGYERTWRPRTAIPRAAEDANPQTDPDPAWAPLLTINHPEYPSAHAFASAAVTTAVAAFFGTGNVEWTIVTSKDAVPQLARTTRIYQSLNALMEDVRNARVWAGLHYRNSMVEGGVLGSEVAKHVTNNYFRPRG